MLVFYVAEVSYNLLQYLPNRSQLLLILLMYKEHEVHEIDGAYSVPDNILPEMRKRSCFHISVYMCEWLVIWCMQCLLWNTTELRNL